MIISQLYAIVDAEVLAGRGVALEAFAEELRAAGVGWVQYRDKLGSPQEVLRAAWVLREAMRGGEGVFPGSTSSGPPTSSGQTPGRPVLIMNDRADWAVLAGFDGVHVGQGDLAPEDAKAVVLRTRPTHRMEQERDEWGTQIVEVAGEKATYPSAKNAKGWATQLLTPATRVWEVGGVGVSTHTEAQVRAADVSCADYIAIGPVFATGTKADADAVVGLEGVRRARALTTKPLVAIGGITRANARSVVDAGADSVAVISGLFAPGESVEQVARDFLEILR
jgi:thiamine-phosphate pyrophosphorylase